MKQNLNLVLESFKIDECEKKLIELCLRENPFAKLREISKKLGWSERTLFRKIKIYKIEYIPKRGNYTEEEALSFLKTRGYFVEEDIVFKK